jgi:hypothetical protein
VTPCVEKGPPNLEAEKKLSETLELPNLPWQALQRRLAEAFGAEEAIAYSAGAGAAQQWRFAATTGSWLDRSRRRAAPMRGHAVIKSNCQVAVS